MVTNNATNNQKISGDSGTATGYPITLNANTNCGSTTKFTASGSTISLVTTDANGNQFFGLGAGNASTTGAANVGFGQNTLKAVTSGNFNVALGVNALEGVTIGIENMAIGTNSLVAVTSGNNNVGIGTSTAQAITTGSNNTAIGGGSLFSLTTGSSNIGIGSSAGSNYTSSESNNICIGNAGVVSDPGVIRIGTAGAIGNLGCFITGINGAVVSGGTAIFVNSSNQLGTSVSSERFKKNVRDMGDASSKVLSLRPVTFNYKDQEDETTQYGLIAEEVNEVMPELVVYDKENQPYSIKYHDLPALLLNEIKKLHARIEELERKVST